MMNKFPRTLSLAGVVALVLSVVPALGQADTLRAGTTVLVSTKPDGSPADGGSPSVSADGRYVAFDSWDRLAPGDSDNDMDVYRKDMTSGEIVLVSTNITGPGGNHFAPSISGDGNKVAYLGGVCFYHFVLADLPSCVGIYAFVKDISSGVGRRISDGLAAAATSISRDGLWATVTGEGEDFSRLMVSNTSTGQTTYVSGVCGCSVDSDDPGRLSADGRYIVFDSDSSWVSSDIDREWDVYLYDRDTDNNGIFDEAGKTSVKLVGVRPGGDHPYARYPSISDDGRKLVFVGGDLIDGLKANLLVYVRDLTTSITTMVSKSSQGVPAYHPGTGIGGLGKALTASSDGQRIAFSSGSPDLAVDLNPFNDVFMHNLSNSKTQLVSTRPDGTQDFVESFAPSVSADGRYIGFGTSLTDQQGGKIKRRVYLRDTVGQCAAVCID